MTRWLEAARQSHRHMTKPTKLTKPHDSNRGFQGKACSPYGLAVDASEAHASGPCSLTAGTVAEMGLEASEGAVRGVKDTFEWYRSLSHDDPDAWG